MLLFFTLICFGSWRQERARNFKSSSAELSSECSGTEQSWAMTILSTLLSLKISTSNLTFVSKQVKLWIVDINLSIRNLVNQRKTKNINMHLATCTWHRRIQRLLLELILCTYYVLKEDLNLIFEHISIFGIFILALDLSLPRGVTVST